MPGPPKVEVAVQTGDHQKRRTGAGRDISKLKEMLAAIGER